MEGGGEEELEGGNHLEKLWTALHTNISAKSKYSVLVCTLTEKESKSIMYLSIIAAPPKSRISEVMITDVRDVSTYTGGAGVLSLYHYMETSRMSLLKEQLFIDTSLGKNIRVYIKDMVLDAGRYGPLWLMLFPIMSRYVNKYSWVYAVTEYNHNHQTTIVAKHAELKGQKVGDVSIVTATGR